MGMLCTPKTALLADLDAMTSAEYGVYLAANYPCVKHLGQCNQSEIGLGYLLDIVQGVRFNKSAGLIAAPAAPDGFSVFPNQVSAGTTITGTLISPAGSPFLLFQIAKGSTGGFQLGDTGAGPGISLLRDGSVAVVSETTGVYPGTAFTTADTTIMGRGLFVSNYDDAAGIQTFTANATSTNTAHAATSTADSTPSTTESLATSGLDGLSAAAKLWACNSTITNLYMWGLFVFETAPTALQVQQWLAWMTYYASIGKKYAPPGMRGIT